MTTKDKIAKAVMSMFHEPAVKYMEHGNDMLFWFDSHIVIVTGRNCKVFTLDYQFKFIKDIPDFYNNIEDITEV